MGWMSSTAGSVIGYLINAIAISSWLMVLMSLGAFILILVYLHRILSIMKWCMIGGLVSMVGLTIINLLIGLNLSLTHALYVVLASGTFFGMTRLWQLLTSTKQGLGIQTIGTRP